MKKIIAIVMVAVIMLCATGCNSEGDALPTRYEYAYVFLPNGNIVEVELKDFVRHNDGIMLRGRDGEYYWASNNNCILTNIQLDYTESEE